MSTNGNIDQMDTELAERLAAYYADADRREGSPSPDAVWSRLAPALPEHEHEFDIDPSPGIAAPQTSPPVQRVRLQRKRWQGLATVAAAIILVALFARVFTLAFGGNHTLTPAASPSTTVSTVVLPPKESLSALSPDLAADVAAQGSNLAVVVYDVTRQRYYSANESESFVLASSAKVYILVGYLDWLEAQGQAPSGDEIASLTRMIENSNNDDAQLLFDRFGGNAQMQRFLAKISITGYLPCTDGWGCAQLPPSAMARVLALLQQGGILTAADRQLALDLLRHVESDQRMGVGETAPASATVAMKAGWLPWPDPGSQWTLNSSGIVSSGGETYILVVYAQNQPAYDWSMIDHIGAAVAQLLG